jgi:glycine/D-amino acid oxidase-like deaminating enzyme
MATAVPPGKPSPDVLVVGGGLIGLSAAAYAAPFRAGDLLRRERFQAPLAAPRGHGKNGLLLAGLTAEIVLDLIAGNRQDAACPFRLDRFRTG